MNRNQVEEKLTLLLGGLSPDKNLLLELFITKLFEILKPGDSLKIDNLGYFHKIKLELSGEKEKFDLEKSDLDTIIVFSETSKLEQIPEDFIFWKPISFEKDIVSANDYFSISVERDFFSNFLVQSTQVFVPVSQIEQENLIDSKIEKLLSSSFVLQNNHPEETCLKIEVESKQLTYSLEQSQFFTIQTETIAIEEPKVESSPLADESTEIKAFDFTDILNIDEPEEDTISKFDYSLEEKTDSFETLTSSEEKNVQEETFDSIEESSEEVSKQTLEEEEIESRVENETSFDSIFSTLSDEKAEIENKVLDSDKYQVEENETISSDEISWDKIISEINSDDDIKFESIFENQFTSDDKEDLETITEPSTDVVETSDSIDLISQKFDEKLSDLDDVIDEVITDVKKESEEDAVTSIKDFSLSDIEDLPQPNIEQTTEFQSDENITTDEISDEDIYDSRDELVDEKQLEKVEEEFSKETKEEIIEEEKARGSNKLWYLLIVIVVISATALMYYLYPNYFELFQKKIEYQPKISYNDALIIERDFSIPVTYPYPPVESPVNNEIKLDTLSNIETKATESPSQTTVEKNDVKTPKTQENVKQQTIDSPVRNSERVSETVTKSDNSFIVQVASFKSEQVALREVNKLKSKGYSAFVERAEIPNRGVWYRIKVGGFKSSDEAQNFQLKYNRGEL
jgi:cell division septation protein DedD